MSTPMDQAPPPPPPPGAYGVPPPMAPRKSMAERFSPDAMAGRGPWAMLALLAQGIGLLLVFVGTLVVVVAGSYPADCLTMTCTTSTAQGVVYGIETARVLWTLGLFGIAAGAGLKLQFGAMPGPASSSDETQIYLARRRGEFAILVVSIVLLFILLLWSAVSTAGLVI